MKKLINMTMSFLLASLVVTSGCSSQSTQSTTLSEESQLEETVTEEIQEEETAVSTVDTSNYTLEQMVVLSRHNIRSPLSDGTSTLGQMTTHTWFDWSSAASELSLRGGSQETVFGQYFRKYLVSEGLIDENWMPDETEARFYANSLQRTIATTNYFLTGMLPLSNLDVEYHEELGTMDPVFNPQLTYVSDAFKEQVALEIDALNENGLVGVTTDLQDAYTLLEDVLDFKDSTYAAENNMESFALDDTEIILEENKEPKMTGSLKIACSAADALVLQYYENPDATEAAFGHDLTEEQWKMLASIKDTYQELLFGTYSLAVNTAHPLLMELESELQTEGRKFSYLCGHDSNVKGVLVALDAVTPVLSNSLNADSPIGCKLVIEKWLGNDSQEYATLKLVYQNTEQLRNNTLLDLENPPETVDIELNGLEKNEDGFYLYEDLITRFNQAIEAYNQLP